MKYEVVCTKSHLDVGLMIERDDKLEPKRVLARSRTYSSDSEYGIYEGLTWIKTGVFMSKDEWVEISHNKPTDQILRELGINKESNQESIDEEQNEDKTMANFITRETAICGYVCDKYYIIDYNRGGYIQTAKGFLINYYGGNVVLLSEEGVYHIKYKDIVFMQPMKMPKIDKFNEGYQKLIKLIQEDNT